MTSSPSNSLNTHMQQLVDAIRAQVAAEISQKQEKRAPHGRLLTVPEAARYLARSEQAVRHLIHKREIPVIRHGRHVRLDRRDLDSFIENHRC